MPAAPVRGAETIALMGDAANGDNKGWGCIEPCGCNGWQLVANEVGAEAAKMAKSVAAGGDRLPESFHGKEGVDRSSPSEGFDESPAERP